MKNLFKNNSKGFTLMEVMVAVSIFAIIVTIGIVALLTINTNYRKSQNDRTAIDSLTYALESMSRGIRTAQSWVNTSGPSTEFAFKDQDGADVLYYLDGTQVFMTIDNSSTVLPNNTYPVTPENVEVENLTFTTFADTGIQSYVQINIKGKVDNGRQISDFAFQTGVSKRVLDTATPAI